MVIASALCQSCGVAACSASRDPCSQGQRLWDLPSADELISRAGNLAPSGGVMVAHL